MARLKAKMAIILGAGALLAVGAGVAITHHGRSQTQPFDGSEAQAVQEKLNAERAGGPVNVAKDPNAQKQLDEQKALREQQNQAGKQ